MPNRVGLANNRLQSSSRVPRRGGSIRTRHPSRAFAPQPALARPHQLRRLRAPRRASSGAALSSEPFLRRRSQSDFPSTLRVMASVPFPACGIGRLFVAGTTACPLLPAYWKRFPYFCSYGCSIWIFTALSCYRFQMALNLDPPRPRAMLRSPCTGRCGQAPLHVPHSDYAPKPAYRQHRQPRHERATAHQPGLPDTHHRAVKPPALSSSIRGAGLAFARSKTIGCMVADSPHTLYAR